ncbi:hypothetical protein ACA910_008577 [Epithemia clementina (nom. ined.)]
MSSPCEEAPLLSDSIVIVNSETTSQASTTESEETQRLWDELSQPWPATFERSIGLLASPVVSQVEADMFTRSPKPGSTPLALNRRHLRRDYNSPDPSRVLLAHRHSDVDRFESQGLLKVQSLDFASSMKEQAVRADKAKEYRAKILQKQPKYDATKSPGYDREVASLEHQRRVKQAAKPIVEEKSSLIQSSFNLANILMGVGLLGLPFAFRVAGIIGGSCCVFGMALMTWRTTILIGQELNGDPRPSAFFDDSPFKSPQQPGSTPGARMLPPSSSFPEIARKSFGAVGSLILSIILYFELFSCICIFFVTMGDHLHQIFPAISNTKHMVIVATVSVIPAILLRTPTLLSYLSMMGTISTVSVVLSVILAAILEGDLTAELAEELDTEEQRPHHILWDTSGFILALGLVAYCFSGHAILPSIYRSMKEPQKFDQMATSTFLAVTVCCWAVAVAGYFMFGNMVADQVTLSMEAVIHANVLMKGLVWLMILTAFSKTTLTMFPLAIGMEELVAPFLTSENATAMASAAIKVVLTGMALAVSIFVPSFSYLCALVGMICTMCVSIILPAAAHIQMFGSRLSWWEKFLDWSFVFVGFFIAITGTVATL